ncbi:MAG: hypothetical protein O7C67_10130 [Gammaproteobacteria bacterium]|nr:hypothetical protein [Gammaproteobacteria bacterium]
MNWDAVGAVGEILGSVAVLLIYLATQMKQTNSVSRFNTTREIMGQFDDLNRLYGTDSTIRQVLAKKGELSADESEQLYTFTLMYCNAWATTLEISWAVTHARAVPLRTPSSTCVAPRKVRAKTQDMSVG